MLHNVIIVSNIRNTAHNNLSANLLTLPCLPAAAAASEDPAAALQRMEQEAAAAAEEAAQKLAAERERLKQKNAEEDKARAAAGAWTAHKTDDGQVRVVTTALEGGINLDLLTWPLCHDKAQLHAGMQWW